MASSKHCRSLEEIRAAIWITFEEAQRYSTFGHHKVRALLTQGKFRGRRDGKSWVVSRESIDDYMNEPHKRVRIALDGLRG